MARQDLLALTSEDLAAFTNRGTVKRAQKELDSGSPAAEFDETEESLTVVWSDGAKCEFPQDGTLEDAICASGSAGISRHVIRSVLAYQQRSNAPSGQAETRHASAGSPAENVQQIAWDPGTITDQQLEQEYGRRSVNSARKSFDSGVLVELVRGLRPYARFLNRPCVVRFPVPGDIRYVISDCAQSVVAEFASHSVWAFRELKEDLNQGIVSTLTHGNPPAETIGQVLNFVNDLCIIGFAGLPATWKSKAERLEKLCRKNELIWPAEIIGELAALQRSYVQHDAAFDERQVTQCVGELLARCDAILADQEDVPRILIQGSSENRPTEISGARLVGLGCDVQTSGRTTTINAYLQDADTGVIVACSRSSTSDLTDDPASFTRLAQGTVLRSHSIAQFGQGQLLIKSGKRTPGHRLILPRTAGSVTVNRQTYQWQHLRPPHYADSFVDIQARLQLLPPAYLRPRRVAENLFVCPVECVRDVSFDSVTQSLQCELIDPGGATAGMILPFASRGAGGLHRLERELQRCLANEVAIRFVSGKVTSRATGLEVNPLSVVFEDDDGRFAVQPWVDESEDAGADGIVVAEDEKDDPIGSVRADWAKLLSETLLLGLSHCSLDSVSAWRELAEVLAATGFTRTATAADRLTDQLERRTRQRSPDVDIGLAELRKQLVLLTVTESCAS